MLQKSFSPFPLDLLTLNFLIDSKLFLPLLSDSLSSYSCFTSILSPSPAYKYLLLLKNIQDDAGQSQESQLAHNFFGLLTRWAHVHQNKPFPSDRFCFSLWPYFTGVRTVALFAVFYLCGGLQCDSIVKELQHHFDVALFGGQVKPIEPILSEREEQTSYWRVPHTLQ